MSMAGAAKKRQDAADMKLQVDAGFTDKIPLKPEVVVAYEEQMRERRRMILFGRCRVVARGRNLPLPEVEGAMIANNVLNQIMQRMIAAQSQIVVPTSQVVLPK